MKKVISALKIQSFLYDFTKDGGATGTIQTKTIIPATALITEVQIRVLTAYTGGGGCVVTFDWAGNVSFVNQNPPLAANAVSTFDSLGVVALNNSLEILMQIAVAPITAGSFIFFVKYIDSSNR